MNKKKSLYEVDKEPCEYKNNKQNRSDIYKSSSDE